ncbi:MAG TPA: hypothetical protein VJ327_01075 [Patescibacteria group bacterium]|nr:hypothetical protein [Patescibacteria group bacterium]
MPSEANYGGGDGGPTYWNCGFHFNYGGSGGIDEKYSAKGS